MQVRVQITCDKNCYCGDQLDGSLAIRLNPQMVRGLPGLLIVAFIEISKSCFISWHVPPSFEGNPSLKLIKSQKILLLLK